MPSHNFPPAQDGDRASLPDSLNAAAQCLLSGGIVCHPTETCYGLACDLTNHRAVEHLFTLKRRPADKPVSALFSSLEDAKQYVEWNDAAESLAHYFPGALTIILPLRAAAPHLLFPLPRRAAHSVTSIGVRVSSHPIAAALVRLAARPVSTTSANVSDQPEPYDRASVLAQFATVDERPDVVLDGGALPRTPPSTIIDCRDNRLRIVRQGSLRIQSAKG